MTADTCPLCLFEVVPRLLDCANLECQLPRHLWPAVQRLKDRVKELEADNLRMRTCAACGLTGGVGCVGLVCDECHSNLKAELAAVKIVELNAAKEAADRLFNFARKQLGKDWSKNMPFKKAVEDMYLCSQAILNLSTTGANK